MNESAPDLAVIVVAYRSGTDLVRCLDSVASEVLREGLRAEIIVIDNEGGEEAPPGLPAGLSMLWVGNPGNRGFGPAVNQGFRASSAPRVLLLNPDAALMPGSLGRLIAALDAGPWSLVAPQLVLPDGSAQESPRAFYDLVTAVARRTPLGRLRSLQGRLGRHVERPKGTEPSAVDWVTGAAMLLRREDASAAGPFDERYFLYLEDTDLCRRLHATGRKVGYVDGARVAHRFGAGSRKQVPWNPLFLHHLRSGFLYGLRWSEGVWKSRPLLTSVLGLGRWGARSALLGAVAALCLPTLVSWAPLLAAVTPTARRTPLGTGPRPSWMLLALLLSVPMLVLGALEGSVPTGRTLLFGPLASSLLLVANQIGVFGFRLLRRVGLGHKTVVVTGEPAAAANLARLLADHPEEGVHLAGFVVDSTGTAAPGLPSLGPATELPAIARALRADVVLFVGSAQTLAQGAGAVVALRGIGVDAAYVLDGPEELLQGERPVLLAGQPLLPLGAGATGPLDRALSVGIGRCFAAALLLLASPLLMLLSGLSRLRWGGAAVLKAMRIGQGGRPFQMLRLRSGPGPGGDEGGGKFGAALRLSHFDELPQLWNVVRGEMALVGPRPVTAEVRDGLLGWEQARFLVPPGITGVWQIDRLRRWRLEQMIASDLLYLLRASLLLDLRILAETLWRRTP